MADQTTNWYLKLREVVSSPLKKITEMAGGAQKKVVGVANASDMLSKKMTNAGKEVRNAASSLDGLTNNLRRLEAMQAKAFDVKHIQNYQRAINKTKEDIAKWHQKQQLPELQPKAPSWLQKQGSSITDAVSQIPGGGAAMSLAKNPLAMGAVAVGKIAFDSSEISMKWQEGLAKINATAQLAQPALNDLDLKLQNIAEKSGGNFDRVPDAFEKILSVTSDVNGSVDILKTTLKGAKVGFTDIDIVGKSLATTLGIVGKENTNANEILDTYLKAKKIGAGEFSDFANYMPGLIASGKVLNMNWKQTAGIFSYMTQKTKDAADSTMLMKNLFTALSKKDILAGLQANKIQVFNKKGEMRRLDEILIDLDKKLGLKSTKQKLAFFDNIGLHDAQAKEALQTLLADTNELKRSIDGVNNSFGETNKQLNATGNAIRNWKDVGDTFKSIGKDIGDFLLPWIDKLSISAQGLLSLFKKDTWKQAFDFKNTDESLNTQKRMVELASNFARNKMASIQQNWQIGIEQVPKAYKEKYQDNLAAKGLPANDANMIAEYKKELTKVQYDTKLNELKKQQEGFYKNQKFLPGGVTLDFNKVLDSLSEKKGYQPFSPLEKLNPKKGGKAEDITTETKTKQSGNSGLRTLIMNVNTTNNIKTEKDVNKFKDDFTDILVDAGRDSLVTLGMD